MTNLDQFESVFHAAEREIFRVEPAVVRKVLCITDMNQAGAQAFTDHCRDLLSVLPDDVEWKAIPDEAYADCEALLKLVDDEAPSLICTYRCLKSEAYKWPFSLGLYLNVLTRRVAPPVCILPHPKSDDRHSWTEINTDRVLVVTDHLTGDDGLVNWGLTFTEPGGKLLLAHVEDDEVFQRYADVIAKLPEVPTDAAVEQIKARLLQEPADYIASVAEQLERAAKRVEVVPIVQMGHKIDHYRRIVESHECDLVVFRTREPDQTENLAIGGVAYLLALEIRRVPLLMI